MAAKCPLIVEEELKAPNRRLEGILTNAKRVNGHTTLDYTQLFVREKTTFFDIIETRKVIGRRKKIRSLVRKTLPKDTLLVRESIES